MEQEILLKESNTVKDAVKILEEKNIRGVFVVDDSMFLKGIFTQGDLRRYILKNGEMDSCIVYAMNFGSSANLNAFMALTSPLLGEQRV